MIADMHCHYPMRLVAEAPRRRRPPAPSLNAEEVAATTEGRPGWADWLRGYFDDLIARIDQVEQEYMLSPETIERIARRDGVIGLILARRQLHENAGVEDPDDPAETPVVLRRHIDAVRACVPGETNAHVAIGSDLDGFIKPTMAGIETAGDLATLARPLRDAYGDDAEAILAGNALRVARKALATR